MPSIISPRHRSPAGFSLVEMLVVISTIALLAVLSVSAFKGSPGNVARAGASVVAEVFSQARTEAIMRQTPCAVILDTADKTDTVHYLRRLMVVYQSGTSSGVPVWSQASSWIVLPTGAYVDRNWSTLNGSGTVVVNGNSISNYAVYAFSPNGQAYNPYAGGSTLSQVVVSMGSIDTSGNFTPRAPLAATANPSTAGTTTISKTAYGFVVFPMGRIAFIQDFVNDTQTPVNTFSP